MNPLLIKFAPWIAGGMLLLSLAGATVAYLRGRSDGQKIEASANLAADNIALVAANKKSTELQAQVDAAALTLSAQQTRINDLERAVDAKRVTYYVQNPAAASVVCLSDSRFLHHQEQDRTTENSSAPG